MIVLLAGNRCNTGWHYMSICMQLYLVCEQGMTFARIASLNLVVEPSLFRPKSGSTSCYDTHLHLEANEFESARIACL